jgi:hypothetical protein
MYFNHKKCNTVVLISFMASCLNTPVTNFNYVSAGSKIFVSNNVFVHISVPRAAALSFPIRAGMQAQTASVSQRSTKKTLHRIFICNKTK